MKRKRSKQVVKVNIVGEITPETLTERDGHGFTLLDIIRATDSPRFRLEIFLSSPGGDIDTGMAIYEALRTTEADVHIYGYGIVASIAVLIFMGGDERVLTPGTRMFLHPGTYMSEIPESILTIKAKTAELAGLHTWYCETLFERAKAAGGKVEIKDIFDMCDKDSFFSAHRALEMGLATKIRLYEE